ncbi:MAG: hypothetical protein ACFB51_05665, partial [Anaerolineae bacterium]
MTDTQWPRWLVFEQSSEKSHHTIAGSVHAPDAELALLNARDVFVRRPQVISLWLVRADRIYSKTAEEMANNPDWASDAEPGETETYLVFQKLGHRGKHTHAGEDTAASPPAAVSAALEALPGSGRQEPDVWWVVPDRLVYRSTEADIAEMFEIARS